MDNRNYTREEIELLKTWGHGKDDEQSVQKGIKDINGNLETLISLAKQRKDFFDHVQLLKKLVSIRKLKI